MSDDSHKFRKAIEEKSRLISDNLYKIANRDEQITVEEHQIVEKVLYTLKDLQEQVISAIDDDLITKAEKKTLSRITAKIVTGSHEMALSDDILTPDESALLQTIKTDIVDLQELVYQLPIADLD